jgi:nucleotide-binding universal stress UspA family protein
MPTTLLQMKDGRLAPSIGTDGPEEHLKEIKKGAKESATAVKQAEDMPVEKVHLTARAESRPTKESIKEEARKGYDMLLVGLDHAMTEKGNFTKSLTEISKGFEGPMALVLNGKNDPKQMPQLDGAAKILVPVNGTEVSRRAAEIAFALARPNRARVKVLYVSPAEAGRKGASVSRRREEAILKDIADLGERYDVLVQTAMRTRVAPDVAVCREADKGVSMIVMGVTQRPGEELFFGNTASAVLAKCQGPIMLIATDRAVQKAEPDTKPERNQDSEKAQENAENKKKVA